ncbi:HD domain-containing protein [Alteribacter natronophilus]|uniref:HD domain-containing protein n=1 Tax=Alteribacter natronophilus TaxID=2583810 RepID=UPI00110E00CC|nr:HD domain-containing protein [Alteribacter natronophilus]TMW70366.1 HD domain-containing protein [Alteribacter natronophilus]
MDQERIILETEKMVRDQLQEEQTGHDWFHIDRVTRNAAAIAEAENADVFVVTLAALLHDLADDKVVDDETEALQDIEDWLTGKGVAETDVRHVMKIIQTISFKGGNGQALESLEAKVVQDADRLDAIGAVGIARCFVYSGSKGSPMYGPDIKARESMTKEEYRKGKSTAVNHFYEKLLKLRDLMNTRRGYELADERHKFMETFLEQFYREVGR